MIPTLSPTLIISLSDSPSPQMDHQAKPRSAKTKLVRTIRKIVHLQPSSRPISDCGILKLKTNARAAENDLESEDGERGKSARNRALLEAFVAKLFAGISSVKAAYAELQMAQSPYNNEAIHSSDESVVKELRLLSELKHGFLRKQVDSCPPHVTMMLAEIQEQQSLMRTYEISLKSLESQSNRRDSQIISLQAQLEECETHNKKLEKKLNSSGYLYTFENIKLANLNPTHVVQVLQYTLKSLRTFVKQLVREMETANWDLQAAANSIQPNTKYTKSTQRCYAFESFVTREIFEGFDSANFSLPIEINPIPQENPLKQTHFFDRFKDLKSANPKHYIASNPDSAFAAFAKGKYLKLVHPKMECSLFGNLRQRNKVTTGECPDTAFFVTFAEMAKRVWLLHSLAYSFDEEATIFQVRKGSRFSEVFMEAVNDEEPAVLGGSGGDLRVGFTVAPGFKTGKTVIQCQVYISPAVVNPGK